MSEKLLKGILLASLEGKSRETKSKILKKAGFNKSEIVGLCGPSDSALRSRKQREKKK